MPGGSAPACTGYDPSNWDNCYGMFKLSDGNKYVGLFRGGKPHGEGVLTGWTGDKFVGNFRNSMPWNGTGAIFTDIGQKYVGDVRDGKMHGKGTVYYLEDNKNKGDKYVGEFHNNKLHGQGKYTFADGRVLKGLFKNNKFISTSRDISGTIKERLRKLKDIHQKGLISDEDYQMKKGEILNQL